MVVPFSSCISAFVFGFSLPSPLAPVFSYSLFLAETLPHAYFGARPQKNDVSAWSTG